MIQASSTPGKRPALWPLILWCLGVIGAMSMAAAGSIAGFGEAEANGYIAWAGLASAALITLGLISALPRVYGLRELRLPGVLLVTYLLFIATPSLFVYTNRPGAAASTFYLAILSFFLAFPAGVQLGTALHLPRQPAMRRRKEPDQPRPPGRLVAVWNVWLVFSLLVCVLYVALVPRLPLVQLFVTPGDTASLESAREESFKSFPVVLAYFFSWARAVFIPYGALLALIVSKTIDHSQVWRNRARLAFAIAFLFAAASSAKGPAIDVVVMYLAVSHILSRGAGSVKRLLVLALVTSAVSTVAFVQVFGISAQEGFQAFLNRTFQVPVDVAYYYFLLFPSIVPFLHGQSIGLLVTLLSPVLQLQFFDVQNYLFLYIFPWGINTGSANAVFVADFWADFGWPGVVLGSVMVGASVQLLQRYAESQHDVWGHAFRGFLQVAIALSLLSVSFPVALMTGGVLVALLGTVVMRRMLPTSLAPVAEN